MMLFDFEKPIEDLFEELTKLQKIQAKNEVDVSEPIKELELKIKNTRKEIYSKNQSNNSDSFALYNRCYVLVKRRIHCSTSIGRFKNRNSTCDLFCGNVFCFILYG